MVSVRVGFVVSVRVVVGAGVPHPRRPPPDSAQNGYDMKSGRLWVAGLGLIVPRIACYDLESSHCIVSGCDGVAKATPVQTRSTDNGSMISNDAVSVSPSPPFPFPRLGPQWVCDTI